MREIKSMSSRWGVSLIELVAVLAAGSLLMSVTISAVIAVRRADQRFTRQEQDRRAMSLLVDRLRRDVHGASQVSWEAEASRLTMTTPDGGRIVYELDSRRWERRVSDASDEQLQLSGAYRAPTGFACGVSPAEADEGLLVHFVWTATTQSHDASRGSAPPVELVAAVGRDQSLLSE